MESLEDLAIEEIQQQYENEQELIDQVSQDRFGMNDDKIDEAIEIVVNEIYFYTATSKPSTAILAREERSGARRIRRWTG